MNNGKEKENETEKFDKVEILRFQRIIEYRKNRSLGMEVYAMKRLITVIVAVLLIAFLFRPVYMTETGCNWLLLWLCIGIPFGLKRLFLLLPRGYDLGGTIGLFVFGILISGLIGGVVLIWELLNGITSTVKSVTRKRTLT